MCIDVTFCITHAICFNIFQSVYINQGLLYTFPPNMDFLFFSAKKHFSILLQVSICQTEGRKNLVARLPLIFDLHYFVNEKVDPQFGWLNIFIGLFVKDQTQFRLISISNPLAVHSLTIHTVTNTHYTKYTNKIWHVMQNYTAQRVIWSWRVNLRWHVCWVEKTKVHAALEVVQIDTVGMILSKFRLNCCKNSSNKWLFLCLLLYFEQF